jgi:predicted enzyme related to lactoylglutathione lyase
VGDREVGGMTALSKAARKTGTPSYWFSYVAVDDAAAIATKAAQLGGKAVLDPMEMGPANIAVLKDPTGAVFGLWQSLDATGTFDDGQANVVRLNELSTHDVELSGRFYSGLFGWRERAGADAAQPYKTFVRGDEIVAGMLESKNETAALDAWTVYFAVRDAARVVQKATYLGAKIVAPLIDVPGAGPLAILSDPEGAQFAVVEMAGGVVEEARESSDTTVRVDAKKRS